MLFAPQAGRTFESWHFVEDLAPYVWRGHNNVQTGMKRSAQSGHDISDQAKPFITFHHCYDYTPQSDSCMQDCAYLDFRKVLIAPGNFHGILLIQIS